MTRLNAEFSADYTRLVEHGFNPFLRTRREPDEYTRKIYEVFDV